MIIISDLLFLCLFQTGTLPKKSVRSLTRAGGVYIKGCANRVCIPSPTCLKGSV